MNKTVAVKSSQTAFNRMRTLCHLAKRQLVKCHLAETVMGTTVDCNILSVRPINNVNLVEKMGACLGVGMRVIDPQPNEVVSRMKCS